MLKLNAHRKTVVLLLLLALAPAMQAQPAHKTEVWMGGRNPLVPMAGHPITPGQDFFRMFEPGAPWLRTAQGTTVFQLPPSLIYKADKATLSKIFAALEERHIALGVEFGWLHGPLDHPCGMRVEGYAAPGSAGLMARIIKAAGGNLQYVAMDEPLQWGHNYTGQNACRYSIEQTALVVAEGVAQVRVVFPNVKIGDTEPVGSKDPTWPAQIKQWLQAYRNATHTPLAFLHADIQWNEHWQQQVPPVKGAAHQAHMPFGIIYDGVGNSDVAWTNGAADRFRQIEANPEWKPDHAIFETWEYYPTACLPESKPGTLTNLALRYIQQY